MLDDKTTSCDATLAGLLSASDSTPRLLAQGRGKAGHYGCAVPFLALGCASLTQAMHQTEFVLDRRPPPSMREERTLRDTFDWDGRMPLSTRCRAALSLMRRALLERAAEGQPLWPVPASSRLGAFYARRASAKDLAVISLDAGEAGWAMALRLQPGEPAARMSGPWGPALAGCRAEWMAPLPPAGHPDRTVALHALSAVVALHAAHSRGLVKGRSVLFRGPSATAFLGLAKGDPGRPAVQDAAMLLGAACLDLALSTPLFVPRAGPVADRSPRDLDIDWDQSSPALRRLARDLAAGFGTSISLDVFASSSSTISARYFSAAADPVAEGQDAFAQPDWGASTCPLCGARHQEFVLLAPPHAVVAQALRKAESDEVCGVLVAPYQLSAPWWPRASAASRTPSPHASRASSPFIRWRRPRALLNPSGASLPAVAICVFDVRPDPARLPFSKCPGAAAHRGPTNIAQADDDTDGFALPPHV